MTNLVWPLSRALQWKPSVSSSTVQTRTILSPPAVASISPDQLQLTHMALPSCANTLCASENEVEDPVSRFQTMRNPSCPVVASWSFVCRAELVNTGEKAELVTPRSWATSWQARGEWWCARAAQTFILPSVSVLTRTLPSGLNARAKMVASWESMLRTSCFWARSQIDTWSSSPAVARNGDSGQNWQTLTPAPEGWRNVASCDLEATSHTMVELSVLQEARSVP